MLGKKGFSIIEMVIVLVVIGIIATLAVVGNGLYKTSRIKADLATIYKLETALRTYYLNASSLPAIDSNGILDVQQLVDSNIITDAELQSRFYPGAWRLRSCTVNSSNRYEYINESTRTKPIEICIEQVSVGTEISSHIEMTCQIESTLDDENYLGGKGRLVDPYMPPAVSFTDCANKIQSGVIYAYRVF